MARYEERAENYKMRSTHRLSSICNNCDSLQLLCLCAVSQIISHDPFGVLCQFLRFFYDKTCL